MFLRRHGIYKFHGWTSLFSENDPNSVKFEQRQSGPKIIIGATADRNVESKASYHYELRLTPEEVIRCLLTLPPATIPEAIRNLSSQFNLGAIVPDIIRQLADGAISAPKPSGDQEVEDLEDVSDLEDEEQDS